MSKPKTQKTADTKREKNNIPLISAGILIIAVAVYFLLPNFSSQKSYESDSYNNSTNENHRYEFKKEGELVFTDPNGKEISEINIEIAENDDARMTGLMYRTSMKENQGMLFIFTREEEQSFWMKNTVLALDMIFVNSKMEIVKIHHNTTPFSEQSYSSGKPAEYVIEVNAGYSYRMGIKEGDKIIINRD